MAQGGDRPDVIAAVEVESLDAGEQAAVGDGVQVGPNSTVSWRLAPSVAHSVGMPLRSEAIDHFQPSLALSVGSGPVPSPPQGALC